MEETSISFQLKRIVFFFCILYFGLGGCLSNLAMAKDPFNIFISGVHKRLKFQRLIMTMNMQILQVIHPWG